MKIKIYLLSVCIFIYAFTEAHNRLLPSSQNHENPAPPTVRTTVADSICPGQNYDNHTATGNYIDTFTSSGGGDSIRTLHLTVLTPATFTQTKSICQGYSFNGYSATGVYRDTFTGMNGCDSFYILNLTVKPIDTTTAVKVICAGQSYQGHSVAGVYVDTLTGRNGCDSIHILTLVVNPVPTDTIYPSVCPGQSYLGHNGAGTYIDTLAAADACDSLVIINLSVYPAPDTAVITENDTNYLGLNLTNGTYEWNLNGTLLPGDTTQYIHITQPGYYSVLFTDANGCPATWATFNAVYTSIGTVQMQSGPQINIFPNPASGVLNIEVAGLAADNNVTVSIFNQLGQRLISTEQTPLGTSHLVQLNVQSIATGVYLVQVQQNTGIARGKLVIER